MHLIYIFLTLFANLGRVGNNITLQLAATLLQQKIFNGFNELRTRVYQHVPGNRSWSPSLELQLKFSIDALSVMNIHARM